MSHVESLYSVNGQFLKCFFFSSLTIVRTLTRLSTRGTKMTNKIQLEEKCEVNQGWSLYWEGGVEGLVDLLHAAGVVISLKGWDLICGGGGGWLFCGNVIVINT